MTVKRLVPYYGLVFIRSEATEDAIAKRLAYIEHMFAQSKEDLRSALVSEDEHLSSLYVGLNWRELGDAVAELEGKGLERGVHFFATGPDFGDEELPPGVTMAEGEKPWDRVYSYSPPA